MKLNNLRKDENGNGVLICILVLFIMLGIGGLVVDASILYKAKGEMKKAANAAVLSGAQEIYNSNDAVTKVANDILKDNYEDDCTKVLTIKTDTVTVNLTKKVSLYFMRIFGVNTATLNVESTAQTGKLGIYSGAVPIGMPYDTDFTKVKSFDLNNPPGEGENGNYGFLDFSNITYQGKDIDDSYEKANGGANTLGYYIEKGFDGDIGLNYSIMTKTGLNGVEKGQVGTAIENRINNNDRILLIILYDEGDKGKGKKPIIVRGFAYFYLEGIEDDVIKGEFIKYAPSGSIDNNAKGNGAYVIKLIE